MIGVLSVLCLGAVTFVEQELEGLVVASDVLTGAPIGSFRQADLDGDGAVDLVMRTRVWFQRDGVFPEDASVAIPKDVGVLRCDVWKDTIYLLGNGHLVRLRCDGENWSTISEQDLAPPRGYGDAEQHGGQKGAFLFFDRFLHDFDGDGVAEVVLAGEDRLHVHILVEGAYGPARPLDVYPPLRLKHPPTQVLWPPLKRQVVSPSREMGCRLVFEGPILRVLWTEDSPDRRIRYRSSAWQVDPKREEPLVEESREDALTGFMPTYMLPVRLNQDDTMDFAGVAYSYQDSAVLPIPINETSVSTDGGATVRTVRSKATTPRCSFVDFDRDGDLDMLTESTKLFDGGIRETVARFITSNRIGHAINVYLQDEKAGYPTTPTFSGEFTVRLSVPPARGDSMFSNYREGKLFDLSGDIDGDGWCDVVLRDMEDRLAVHLCDGARFHDRPDAVLSLSPGAWFSVADINGDGRSDIVANLWGTEGDVEPRTTVYFSREDAS